MKIIKLHIKDLFGICEYEGNGRSYELVGKNGSGKTSVLDAIRFALTNGSERDVIIRDGVEEGYVYIETDTGISIERKKRRDKADAIKVKDNGKTVDRTTEAFIRRLFTPLQLDPAEFLQADTNEQNRIILDMIDFQWDLAWIKEQFGELPPDVDYQQNILRVLNDIQAEDGFYFQTRQEINREIRNKKAIVEEIGAALPPDYKAQQWKTANLGDLYAKIEKIRRENRDIERAQIAVKSIAEKTRGFEADREIKKAGIEKESSARRSVIEQSIIKLEEEIKAYKTELKNLEEKKLSRMALVDKEYEANIAEFKAAIDKDRPLAMQGMTPVTHLLAEAEHIEKMKAFINEHERMVRLQEEIAGLQQQSELLTVKIETARRLPGEILAQSSIPVDRLTVVNGKPLINGLPVSNLSDGEKLDLCVDIAKTTNKTSALNLLLIDGIEKLSQNNRDRLYGKCRDNGVQFIATRTTDDEDLTVIEL